MSDSILEINLGALADNYRILKQQLHSNITCAAVVKANAYGIGVEKVAHTLAKEGCQTFYVATLEEGLELRKILPNALIYVLFGVHPSQERSFLDAQLIPILNDTYQISLWQDFARKEGRTLPAILHVDTGMCRLGLSVTQFHELWANHLEGIECVQVMSHLACSNEPEHFLNARQLILANDIKSTIGNTPFSLANSSGIYLGAAYHFNQVRPGIALYGGNPLPAGAVNTMKTVVTVKSPILQARKLEKTETVGYGATYEAKAGSRIAVVAVGYADGYFRSLSNTGKGYVAGHLVPIVGRVSMDLVTIDVTNVPEHAIHPGVEVEFIGPHVSLSEVASQAGTIDYEVLTHLGKRYKRVYKEK